MNDAGFSSDPLANENSLMPMQSNAVATPSAYHSPAPVWLDNTEDEGVDILAFLHSLRRKWLPGALIGCVVATIAAALLWVLIPVNSEAVALIRVSMAQQQVLRDKMNTNDQRQYEVYKQTQAALVKSPYVLSAALRPPEIQQLAVIKSEPKPLALLERELNVGYPGNSEILRVSMSGDNEKETIAIVNAVVESYINEVAQNERNQLTERLSILRNQHRSSAREIQEQTSKIQSLAEEFGTSDSQLAVLNQQLEMDELRAIDKERVKARDELNRLQGELFVLDTVRKSRVFTPSEYQIADMLEKDREYYEAKLNVDNLQRQMREYGGVARGGSAMVGRMQQEIASWQEIMNSRKRELLPRITERVAKDYGVDENLESSQYAAVQARKFVAEERYKQLEQEFTDQVQKVQDLTGFSEDLVTRRNDLKNLQESDNAVVQEINRLQLNINSPNRVSLIQKAIIPDRSSIRLKQLEVGAAWLATFLLSLIGVSAWDFLSKRLNSGKDIEKSASLPVIGSLPALRGGWLTGPAREAQVADCIDSIRAAIDYGNRGKKINSVVVTSALGHEGKSTLASQLAVSLARGGRRTLLIDGDVRNPQQHVVFGLPGDRGLCDVLRGQATLEEVVQTTPAENLWILPSGRCDTVAFQALAGPATGVTLERLKSQFDFIVIDAGPVLTGPEALIFGQHVDGAVISTRRDHSRVPKVDDATRRLRSVGVHVIGAVVNGVNAESRSNLIALPPG